MLTVWLDELANTSLRPRPFIPRVIEAFRPLLGEGTILG